MPRDLEDMDFNQLVDWGAGVILQELIAGKLKSGVFLVLNTAINWRLIQDEKEKS